MVRTVLILLASASLTPLSAANAHAPAATAAVAPYPVEWVYRVKYGYQDEWWHLFQKYQIAALDEQKRRGFIRDYKVYKPELHTSEDSRWDYRIEIVWNGFEGSTHEEEVAHALFPDTAARTRDENRRWELTLNHWDLPIRQVDPHVSE